MSWRYSLPPPTTAASFFSLENFCSRPTASSTLFGSTFSKLFMAYSSACSDLDRAQDLVGRDRQLLEPSSGRVEDRVGDRPDRRRDRRLAYDLAAERPVRIVGIDEDDFD